MKRVKKNVKMMVSYSCSKIAQIAFECLSLANNCANINGTFCIYQNISAYLCNLDICITILVSENSEKFVVLIPLIQ